MLTHAFLFFVGIIIMWLGSGLVITGIERFSKTLKISAFLTSFLMLGVLTSLTEISVGFNAVFHNRPGIFVGNLIGGSFVILSLIIPMLAIANRGIRLNKTLQQKELFMFLVLLIAPAFIILDGKVNLYDALLLIFLYSLFVYHFQRREKIIAHLSAIASRRNTALKDIARIVVGAGLIYFSAKMLVDGVIYVADYMQVPSLLISLLVLSVGTNLPEIIVAIRAIAQKKTDIAFGDYIGSASFNTLLFGVFSLMSGSFAVEVRGFSFILLIMAVGYALFFFFGRSKETLSPTEGFALIMVYVIFTLLQINEIVLFSPVV